MRPTEFLIAVICAGLLAVTVQYVLRAEDYQTATTVFAEARARRGEPHCVTITSPADIAGDVCVNYPQRVGDVEVERDEVAF